MVKQLITPHRSRDDGVSQVGQFPFYRCTLRGIKPNGFHTAIQGFRGIRVICEICGLKKAVKEIYS